MKSRKGFMCNSRPSKRTMLALGLMLGLCPVSETWAYAADKNESQVVAQAQKKVNGTVVDASGEPLIGVNVSVVGRTGGTITDIDGKYTIDVPAGAQLKFSYIGYQDQVLTAGAQSVLNVTMKESTEVLQEVVVVGYGSQKKETLTGAVTVVNQKMLANKGSVSSPVQALQGQVPGVIITRSSGAPGDESWGMKLRGAVSANNTDPLVIVDGVEYSDGINGLRLLNSDDIESINFLKDASAAIYGSKAAGGVVLIQTKKAKEGKTVVQYSGSFTGKVVGLQPELMSLNQWADAVIEAYGNDGVTDNAWTRYATLAKQYRNKYIDLTKNPSPISNGFTDVSDFVFMDNDWQDILWGNASSTQHELSISGGTEKSLFRLSAGYMYDGSTLQWGNNNNQRFNLRLTNQLQLSKNFSLESVIAYNRQDQVSPSQIGSVLSQSMAQPGMPSSTIDGRPYAWGGKVTPNWLAELGGDNKLKVSAINISEAFKYKIYSDLEAVVNLGYNTSTATRDIQILPIKWYNYAGTQLLDPGDASVIKQKDSSYSDSFSRTDYYMISGYLNWHKSFKEAHNVSAMVGAQYNLTQYKYTVLTIKDIQSALEVPNGAGTIELKNGDNKPEKYHEAMMSYFGRFNYNYKQRYLLEANLRYDGSSKFQPENRWQFFYGFSAGWRLKEESFMKNVSFLNDLKLRLSYGVLGNQNGVDRYDGVQLYNFTSLTGPYIGSGKVSYIDTNGKIVSTDRTWERIHNYNIGLDFAMLDNRLTGTVELFMKKNNNMLIEAKYPGVLGDNAPTANLGEFEAKGWEGTATWTDKIGQVKYHVGGSVTYATNELINLGATTVSKSGFVDKRQGYPLNSYFGLRYCGKIQTEEERQKYLYYYNAGNGIGLTNNIRLGDNMFEDVNGDGKLDDKDYVYLGSDDPKLSYSINAGIEWKGFDISVVFQGVGRRTVFRGGTGNESWRIPMNAVWTASTTQAIGNTWSPEHRDAYYPTYTLNYTDVRDYNYQCSSWSVENGAYIRLKNVTVGYNFPSAWLTKTKVISQLRLYLTGSDIWEHSNMRDGWDPEASRTVKGNGRYPFNRTYTVGINATF